jgi:hypothetical protein
MVNQKFPARWRFQKGPPGQPARKIVHVLAPTDAGGALAVRHRNADMEYHLAFGFADKCKIGGTRRGLPPLGAGPEATARLSEGRLPG